ncbi:uncharacterized protein [Triticum aestivum]|uniref:uncharacterized protein isoform X4 n=1 Tax=Triticum aestivum TaxID=4565 RepID=UPI001D00AEEB|nr:uncharacterized protein LOC123152088 isoform X4 [Triticum aestivum]
MQSKRILLCIPYAWTEWEAAAAMLDSEPKPSHAANNLHLFAEITTSVMYWQSDAFRIGSQNFQPRLELACSLQFIVILILNESLPRLLGKIFFTFSNHYCSGILSGAHPGMVRGKPTTGHHLSRKQTEGLHSQGTMKPTIHVI